MKPKWADLGEQDRAAFRAAIAFLKGRLEDRETIEWAIHLTATDVVKRLALIELLSGPDGQALNEPWRTAWSLIEECWNSATTQDQEHVSTYYLKRRLNKAGPRGALIEAIVRAVAPRIKVEALSSSRKLFQRIPKRPRKFDDLLSAGLTSGETVDPAELGIHAMTDRTFVMSLANALDAAVVHGLDVARRIGWDGERRLWQLGGLNRVYYVPDAKRPAGQTEPDEFHRGIAPSVKLFCAVVSQLIEIDVAKAVEFADRWQSTDSPIYARLWATLACDARFASGDTVGAFLLSLNQRRFWNLHDYPEIAELRSIRFADLSNDMQSAITARVRKLPPRDQWGKKESPSLIKDARAYWAARELKRIEIWGSALPKRDREWLAGKIEQFPELSQMTRVDDGFIGSHEARWIPPNPDRQYDLLQGIDRLAALETALSSPRRNWDDDPAGRAGDWIREGGNSDLVLGDLETVPNGGAAFARVWQEFGWAHKAARNEEAESDGSDADVQRILVLLERLPKETLRQAIDGISSWLSWHRKSVVVADLGLVVWFRAWTVAVEATNAQRPGSIISDADPITRSAVDSDSLEHDSLNTPVGKLVDVFLAACPNVDEGGRPFSSNSVLAKLRDYVVSATGHSRLVALYRLIEELQYFLFADPDWARENLVKPLTSEHLEALSFWRALASRTRFGEVLSVVGNSMTERAIDPRLPRETRQPLVFSLVIECLYALRQRREPAVPYSRIQQTLRVLDDETRAHAAEAIGRFVRDLSAQTETTSQPDLREDLFRASAGPFLSGVWPQEHSLATPGVSGALADLPAFSGEAFAEAVKVIERFLVPFECWSMMEYGFFDEGGANPKLSDVDETAKAEALLTLLDLTIGRSEGAVVPHDLSDGLEQIRTIAPKLAESEPFRRLAAAARRS